MIHYLYYCVSNYIMVLVKCEFHATSCCVCAMGMDASEIAWTGRITSLASPCPKAELWCLCSANDTLQSCAHNYFSISQLLFHMFPYFFNIAQTLHACSSDVLLLLMLSKQLTDSIAMYNKHNHYRYLPIMSRSVEKPANTLQHFSQL